MLHQYISSIYLKSPFFYTKEKINYCINLIESLYITDNKKFFYIGVTHDPESRFNLHKKQFPNEDITMYLLCISDNYEEKNAIFSSLHRYFVGYCKVLGEDIPENNKEIIKRDFNFFYFLLHDYQ